MLLVLAVAWFALLRPTFLGGDISYVMVSGLSMEPTLQDGDLVLARQKSAYHVGDLVAFHVPEGERGEGALVIHRITGGSAQDGFRTQGDNNEWLDPWRLAPDDIAGEEWLSVPGAGPWLERLRAPVLLAGLASGVGVFLVMIAGQKKMRPRAVSRTKRPIRPRRLRLPRGLTLLLLLILAAAIVPSRVYAARH